MKCPIKQTDLDVLTQIDLYVEMTVKGRCETPLFKNKAFYDMLEGREKRVMSYFVIHDF